MTDEVWTETAGKSCRGREGNGVGRFWGRQRQREWSVPELRNPSQFSVLKISVVTHQLGCFRLGGTESPDRLKLRQSLKCIGMSWKSRHRVDSGMD